MTEIVTPNTLQARLAKKLLPMENCCGEGCKKCPYGRWLKRRGQHWHILADEALKLISPYIWMGLIILAYIIGQYA
jgi:hypothetical protein